MKITDVTLFRVTGEFPGTGLPPGNRQAKMLDVYPEFNRDARSSPGAHHVSGIYVEIQTDEDVSGLFGPIDETQAFVIAKHLRSHLIGRDPLATETLSDQMLRLNRHGRSGLFMTGVSPVDCALWDLKGKAWGQPIYRLLGGPTRPAVPAYASMLGYSTEPAAAAQVAREYVDMGFAAQKWFFRYGPGDGEMGKAKNVAMATPDLRRRAAEVAGLLKKNNIRFVKQNLRPQKSKFVSASNLVSRPEMVGIPSESGETCG